MDKINEFGDKLFDFIMTNYHNPFFWIILFSVILAIMLWGISELSEK